VSTEELHEWFVTSPEYTYVEIVCEYGGPSYSTRDWEQVQARTAREAVSIAVKKWLAAPGYEDNWCRYQRADGKSPFTGIRAEIARCEHGVEMPLGFSDDFWCDECQARWDAETAALNSESSA
jgi:hypothetical protein